MRWDRILLARYNYIFAGIRGILTESRKRAYRQGQSNHKPTNENKHENQAKNPWGALSETWGVNDVVEREFQPRNNGVRDQGRNIKERLGVKYSRSKDTSQGEDSGEASSDSDSDEDWCKRSKIPRMRMHADDEEGKLQKRRLKLQYQVSYFVFLSLFFIDFLYSLSAVLYPNSYF